MHGAFFFFFFFLNFNGDLATLFIFLFNLIFNLNKRPELKLSPVCFSIKYFLLENALTCFSKCGYFLLFICISEMVQKTSLDV
jgi:hypothetical protein